MIVKIRPSNEPLFNDGFLPVYGVKTMTEGIELLKRTCDSDLSGQFVSPELSKSQNSKTLMDFGIRMHKEFLKMKEGA